MKDECTICMEMTYLATFGCTHKCCISCANKIDKCPLCRRKIVEITHPLSTSKPPIRKPFQEIIPSFNISVKNNVIKYKGKTIPIDDEWELNFAIVDNNKLYIIATHKEARTKILGYLYMDSSVTVINPEIINKCSTTFHGASFEIVDMNKKHILLNIICETTQICFIITSDLSTAEIMVHDGMKFHFTSTGDVVMWSPLETMASRSRYSTLRGDKWTSRPLMLPHATKYEFVDLYAHYVDPETDKETYLPIISGIKHIIPDTMFTVVYEGFTSQLLIKSLSTIDDLKNNIKHIFGVELHHQQLVRNTSRLDEISEIEDGDIIYVWHIEKLSQIFIKLCNDKSKIINILPCDTVWTLKNIIMQKTGIPCKKQAYTFEGKYLIDDVLLADYSIRNGSTLYLYVH